MRRIHDPAPVRAATHRSPYKKQLLLMGAVVCVVAWLAFATALVLGVDGTARLVMLTVALLLTEGLVWLSAAVLGITAFQMRKRFLQKLMRGGRHNVD